MLLHSGVQQVLGVHRIDRRLQVAGIGGVAECPIACHEVVRRVGLFLDELGARRHVVDRPRGWRIQWVDLAAATCKVEASKDELRQIVDIRREELAVPVEVTPHERGTWVT